MLLIVVWAYVYKNKTATFKHILTSSPSKFRWERPCSHEIGVKGNFATTLPSKIELNIDSKEVKAKPIANILFIFT